MSKNKAEINKTIIMMKNARTRTSFITAQKLKHKKH